jgi:hypothetical protein
VAESEKNEEQREEEAPQKPLRERDPAEWKARKARKSSRRAKVRQAAWALGLRLGRWRGGIALVKSAPTSRPGVGPKLCGTVGSPDLAKRFPGYAVFDGGAR